MQPSLPAGMTMFHQHGDDSDPLLVAACGVTPASGMVVSGRSRTATGSTAGIRQPEAETAGGASQIPVTQDGIHDAPGATTGSGETEHEDYVSCYPLTLSRPPARRGRYRKPRRSFSEPELFAPTCESSFRDDVSDMVEPPVVRRCETFTRHMLCQLEHQASATDSDSSDDLLPVVPASRHPKSGSTICGLRKKKTLKADGSSLNVKQQQKCRPSAGSGCHHSQLVTGRRYGPHLLHCDAATGSEAAISGCELDASLKINAGSSAFRCRQATTMIGSRSHGPEGCSLQVNAASRTTCGQGKVRKASGRSLADVVVLWEEFLTAAFN